MSTASSSIGRRHDPRGRASGLRGHGPAANRRISALTLSAALVGLGALALNGCIEAPPPPLKSEHAYKLDRGVHAVRDSREEWFDDHRFRPVPLTIYEPEGKGPFPLIIFSHGIGSDREDYSYLGAQWASHGYVVIHPTHLGTDLSALFNGPGLARALLEVVSDCVNRINRAADVTFILDQLERDADWQARIDPDRIGIAGHSFGAHTALTAIGQQSALCDGLLGDLSDARVKAAVAISPQGEGVLGLEAASWARMTRPCLSIYGTLDVDFVVTDPATRRAAFDRCPAPHQYLVTITGANHLSFTDFSLLLPESSAHQAAHDYTSMSSTAFFDAHLRGEQAAQDWLEQHQIEQVSQGACAAESK